MAKFDCLFFVHLVFVRLYIHTYSAIRVGVIDFSSSCLAEMDPRIEILIHAQVSLYQTFHNIWIFRARVAAFLSLFFLYIWLEFTAAEKLNRENAVTRALNCPDILNSECLSINLRIWSSIWFLPTVYRLVLILDFSRPCCFQNLVMCYFLNVYYPFYPFAMVTCLHASSYIINAYYPITRIIREHLHTVTNSLKPGISWKLNCDEKTDMEQKG